MIFCSRAVPRNTGAQRIIGGSDAWERANVYTAGMGNVLLFGAAQGEAAEEGWESYRLVKGTLVE